MNIGKQTQFLCTFLLVYVQMSVNNIELHWSQSHKRDSAVKLERFEEPNKRYQPQIR